MEATSLMSLCMVYVMNNSYLRGAYYVRKSWKSWELTNQAVAHLQAADIAISEPVRGLVAFGVGFYNFGISLVPHNLEFLVKFLGFSGDRVKSIELLTVASKIQQCGKSVESSLVLYAMNFFFLDGREEGKAILSELLQAVPRSPLLYLMAGWQAMIADKNTDVALEAYRAGHDYAGVPQIKLMFLQQLAWAHFIREDWQEAADLLRVFLTESTSKNGHAYSSFNMGIALYHLGHNEECAKYMKQVVELERKNDTYDSYAATVARAFLANNFSLDRCTQLLLLAENANEAGRAEQSLKYLTEAEKLHGWLGMTNDDRLVMVSYFRGCALRLQKNFDAAKSSLIKAAGYHAKELSLEARRGVPYALLVLGEMAMRDLDQLDAAERFFAKARSYDKKFLFAEIFAFRLRCDQMVLEHKKHKAQQQEQPTEKN